ncbi:MAG TPA: hypothetical protein VGQ11_09515, partial [Candidatus Acidoferrales bacterium]|nr:hypothetical protein [Candidatus Acidoferrales bacterium]
AGSDKFVPFDLSFRWPRTLTLTANGKKLDEHEDGESRTGKWSSDGVLPSAQFSLGGIGWGDVAARGYYRDQWIQEALSAYRTLISEDSAQPARLAAQLESYRRKLTSAWGENETLDSVGPLALGYRLHSSKSPRGFAQLTIPKASWVMHMLRMMLREPAKNSDERFERLLQALAKNYRERAVTTADFQREVEAVMTPEMDLEGTRKTPGRPGAMDWFFDEWVRGTGIPKYSVEFDVKPAGERFLVRGKLKQGGVPPSFIVPVPLYAPRATGGAPVLLGTVITSGAETPFQFTVRVAPRKLLIDPNQTLLCE